MRPQSVLIEVIDCLGLAVGVYVSEVDVVVIASDRWSLVRSLMTFRALVVHWCEFD